MARPLRIEYPGAWYHVMNRGAGRQTIFPDDELRRQFLNLLGDIHDRFGICCHAYCLMGNHYHLLLHTPNAGLGRAMRHLDGVYTQRHNRRLQTDGPLFRGRYKAQLIEDGDYLWTVSRYIHRNPLEAGLCRELVQYPWSSYRFFAGAPDAPAWLKRTRTLMQFGGICGYCSFVEDRHSVAADAEKLVLRPYNQGAPPIIGSKAFVETMLENVPEHYEVPQSKPARTMLPMDAIVAALCTENGRSRDALVNAGNNEQRRHRALIMTAMNQYTAASLREIAAVFGLHYSTAASAIRRFRRAAAADSDLADELRLLRELLAKMGNGQT